MTILYGYTYYSKLVYPYGVKIRYGRCHITPAQSVEK